MKKIYLIIILSILNNAHALICTATKKKGEYNFKIQVKVKNINNVDLLLYRDGIKIEEALQRRIRECILSKI